jgi:hypothetical protein
MYVGVVEQHADGTCTNVELPVHLVFSGTDIIVVFLVVVQ